MQQKTAISITEEVDTLSKNKLKMKDDLQRVIDISIKNNKMSLLEDTAFKARYLQGLFSIIQRGESSIDEDVFRRYMAEYMENVGEVKKNLAGIIEGAAGFYRNIFEDKFFSMTQEGISNLNKLIYDLGWFKMYLNDQKTRSL